MSNGAATLRLPLDYPLTTRGQPRNYRGRRPHNYPLTTPYRMLIDSLFTIRSREETPAGCTYVLAPDAGHAIYGAHFPGSPVTPGVCIIQTLKELAERSIGRPLFLRTVRNAKFLHVIDPRQATEVTFPLAISRPDEGGVAVSCVVTDAVGTLFAKISLLLEEVAE